MSKVYTIGNSEGMKVVLCEYGASVVKIMVSDRNGNITDVALGFDNIEDYGINPSNMGAIVGRYANRIGKGRFNLDGVEYVLDTNDGENTLHSGVNGYAQRRWNVIADSVADNRISFGLISEDMDQGMPGRLNISVTYKVNEENGLEIEYSAVCDKNTILNLTNHTYFNLDGDPTGKVFDYKVTIDSDGYLELDDFAIPTGRILSVEGTPFDFRIEKTVGCDIEKLSGGYNHNYVLNNNYNFEKVASVKSEKSGIKMDVYTTEPGMQLYTAYYLSDNEIGKEGKAFSSCCGICFETQQFPDAINKPEFPSPIILAGEKYVSKTEYRFGIE